MWGPGGKIFTSTPWSSCGWLILIKLTQDKLTEEKENTFRMQEGLVEMGSKEVASRQLILFRQRNNGFERNWQDKET